MRYFAVLLLLLPINALAQDPNSMVDDKGHIIGVAYTSITVNGKVWDVPLANKDYTQDVFFLKKALNGDKEALEIFLGGQDHREFFIGSSYPIWLTATKDGNFSVMEIK